MEGQHLNCNCCNYCNLRRFYILGDKTITKLQSCECCKDCEYCKAIIELPVKSHGLDDIPITVD